MKRPIVFLGPSLPVSEARAILGAAYRPPAGQGDLVRAALDRPPAIALIDGVFKDAPTVRHREILWAMSQGIPVFGAASMGALRAAELCGQGMIGVGLIFRWYRRYALLPDDAVAVTHGPAELGSPPLSDALVDLRRTLAAARRAGAITAAQAAQAREHAAQQPFPQRHLPQELAPYALRQKARDAARLLHEMAQCASTGAWPHPETPPPPIAHAWRDDLRDSGVSASDLFLE